METLSVDALMFKQEWLDNDDKTHESAYVDEPCEIGAGTNIWHFSYTLPGVKIGRNCIAGQNCQVANDVVIGSNVKVQNNASIYTGATIAEDVFLGPSCVLTNVTNPRSQVNRHSLYEKTLIRRGATMGGQRRCGVWHQVWADTAL